MKKSLLVLALFGFVASNSYAADISGDVGVKVGTLKCKKTKTFLPKDSKNGKGYFKGPSIFTYGFFANVNYRLNPLFYIGLDLGIDLMSKKAKLYVDEAGAKSLLGNAPDGEGLDQQIYDGKVKMLSAMSDTKDYVHVKYKSMFSVGAHFGYNFTPTVFAELGLSYVHNNAKIKVKKLDKIDTKLKTASVKPTELLADDAAALTAYNELGELIKKNAKIKKNGLGISLNVGANVAPSCKIVVGGKYVTSIKLWTVSAGVAYVF